MARNPTKTPKGSGNDSFDEDSLIKANGRLNVRTQHLLLKLRKKGVAPEDFLADVIAGKAGDIHPLVQTIMEIVRSKKTPTRAQWEEIVDLARDAFNDQSMLVHIPVDLRVSAAMKMMPHIYPTLKSQEIKADVDANVRVPKLALEFTTGPSE